MKNSLQKKLKNYFGDWKLTVLHVIFAVIVGIAAGLVGTSFYFCMEWVTKTRGEYPWLILFLPAAGVLIVALYQLLRDKDDSGTNLILSSIHSGDNIPLRMTLLIYVSTLLTHLCGGSAGREGAALQMGGSIGKSIGKLFRLDENEQKLLVMCGMSAAFSAVFGTPLAAAFFAIEVVSVGIMHYSALLPCVISSLIAHQIAVSLGASAEAFEVTGIPEFGLIPALWTALLAAICGLLSILFCVILHESGHIFRKLFKNQYLRVIVGGAAVVGLTFLVGDTTYNGTGMDVIAVCFTEGIAPAPAFLLKMIFTAITLAAGFRGGEIVPSFFIGATFGCLFGNLSGLSPSLCAAAGMGAVFCGVTNCPVTSLLICFELFGFEGMPYYLLSIAIAYVMSGYYGLYQSQQIVYSKYRNSYINRKPN